MITLDTNMYMLCSMFNISRKKLSDVYSGMPIEEIMKQEAAQGNTAAANFDSSVLNDPVKLIKLFQLNDVGNKYAILNNMSEQDLEELLPLLGQEELMTGLNFFSKDKLLTLIEKLPPQQLVNMTMQMFSPEQIISYMPEEQLNKIFTSPDVDRSMMEKYLPTLKPEVLAQMLEATTGQPVAAAESAGLDGSQNLDQASLLNQISALPDDKFKEAMINIPPANKQDLVLKMTKENPKLFLLFDPSAYTKMIGQRKNKSDIIKSTSVIKPDELVKMLKKLPKDLTAIVMTQIDTKKFANVLIDKFKDILKQVVAC